MFRALSLLTVSITIALTVSSCSSGGGGGGGGATPPTPPTPPTSNTAPEATLVSPSGTATGDVAFSVTVIDADDDTVSLDLEYSIDGGVTFSTLTRTAASSGVTGLPADADGETYSFEWDSLADGVGTTAVATGVVLRVTPADANSGLAVVGSAFDVDNQPSALPSVTSVSPLFGPAGTVITVEGFNFGSDLSAFEVRIGTVVLRNVSLTVGASTPSGVEGTFACVTSPELEAGPFSIELSGSPLFSGSVFEVAPRINRISTGVVNLPGAIITLHGSRLSTVDLVEFEIPSGSVSSAAPMSVAVDQVEVAVPALTIPAGGTVVSVRALASGVPSNTIGFFFSDQSPPVTPPGITSLVLADRFAAGEIPIDLRLFDTGGTDLATIAVSYSLDGGGFDPCTEGASALAGALIPASPFGGGFPHQFSWDAATDLGSGFQSQVRIRIEPVAQSGAPGAPWTSAPFWVGGEGAITILESFDGNEHEDPITTADWNGSVAGELVGLSVAPPAPWGTGIDGAFQPASGTITLITDGLDTTYGGFDGVFDFTDIDIPSGVTVRASGSNPLVLRATGSVTLDGTIDLSGASGAAATMTIAGGGGAAGSGGTAGGSGGSVVSGIAIDGEPAPRGGQGGQTTLSLHTAARGGGGGGGGMISAGSDGGSTPGIGSGRGGIGGIPRGSADLIDSELAGVGGGGGGGGVNSLGGSFGGGGGGGGGGGAAWVIAQGPISISGTIDVDGGNGGLGFNAGGGGGGSGGLIVVNSATDVTFASGVLLSARAGNGGGGDAAGGDGSDGRVVLGSPNPITLPTSGSGPGSTFDLTNVLPGPGAAGFSQGVVTVSTVDFGSGVDGMFAPVSSVTLLTDGVDPVYGGSNGVFEFSGIDIPAGVVVTALGSNPLVLKCTGDATISGAIDAKGEDGLPLPFASASGGEGGPGGPGGGSGGEGGYFAGVPPILAPSGTSGSLPPGVSVGNGGGGAASVPAPDGLSVAGGGGGGGFATPGGLGETGAGPMGTAGGEGGDSLGTSDFRDPLDPTQVILHGGSGGGGGGGSAEPLSFPPGATMPGAGGGGGGGAVWIAVQGTLDMTSSATVDVRGGIGTSNTNRAAGSGGGGAGGGILLIAEAMDFQGATLVALGGAGGIGSGAATNGGAGADGRIRIETSDAAGGVSGSITPDPNLVSFPNERMSSIAQSLPIPLVNDEGFSSYGSRLDSVQVGPAMQMAPADVRILWGVWQADPDDPTVPRAFSGFTEMLSALPGGEFIQFRVLLESGVIPVQPARLEFIEAQTSP